MLNADRVLRKVSVSQEGCWIIPGPNMPGGHKQVNGSDEGQELAHRAVYAYLVRMVSPSTVLHHSCLTPSCVNPEHLVEMTPTEHAKEHIRLRRIENPLCVKCGSDDWGYQKCTGCRFCKPCRNRWRREHRRKQRNGGL